MSVNRSTMLTVAEAFEQILEHVCRGPIVQQQLLDCLGRCLAQPVVSHTDSPPFDKSLMDGFALRRIDLVNGLRQFQIVEEVTAGRVPTVALSNGNACRIMTGAPIPEHADIVIPIEETELLEVTSGLGPGQVRVKLEALPPAEHFILRRGATVRTGQHVLPVGRTIRPQEIAAMAELGYAKADVIRQPEVAILATGDELVPAEETPLAGQIRNSNEPMLAAQILRMGAKPRCLGIARDNCDHLRSKIREGLQFDFLLLSGGVSAGKLDLVPSELEAAGVLQVFHKIQMRPGKPLWFGHMKRADQPPVCVFGLPGNPVSSMVCCELFVRAALRKFEGVPSPVPTSFQARLTRELKTSGNRPTYHPAYIEMTPEGPSATVVDWIGSADLCATVNANGMIHFPAGDRNWSAGQTVETLFW